MMHAKSRVAPFRRGLDRSVATEFAFDQSFPADLSAVLAMLHDPDYVRHKAEQTGGSDVQVEITTAADGRVVLECTRRLPADVPSYARSFVGDAIVVTERQVWTVAESPDQAVAEVTVDFNAPVSYAGRIALLATPTGTVARNSGSFRASVPFVGGKVERLVAEQTQRYLAKETQVAAEWLATH